MDWFGTVFVCFLVSAIYLVGFWRGSKVKRLDCGDLEAVKRLYAEGQLTPLLKSENGDLYEPTRCVIILDSGKPFLYGTVESKSRLKAPCIENYIDAVVDKAATEYGVSKEEVTKYMAIALTRYYDMKNITMEDVWVEKEVSHGTHGTMI